MENGYNYPTIQNLEKFLKVLGTDFQSVFTFEQHQNIEILIAEINCILKNNPDKVQDFYKILKAIVE